MCQETVACARDAAIASQSDVTTITFVFNGLQHCHLQGPFLTLSAWVSYLTFMPAPHYKPWIRRKLQSSAPFDPSAAPTHELLVELAPREQAEGTRHTGDHVSFLGMALPLGSSIVALKLEL